MLKRPDGDLGQYRRRVRISASAGSCSVDVEDDQHRFGADVAHHGGRVVSVRGRALRTPWTTCPLAVSQLQAFEGTPLLPSPFAALRQVRLAGQCTHLADMAALAIAAAARGLRSREYDAAITLEVAGDQDDRRGTLSRDGVPISHWVLENGTIRAPAAYAGLEMRRAASWIADRTDDPDETEAVFVMQRAVLVTGGRAYDLDQTDDARSQSWMVGACFSFQPDRIATARRVVGSTRDFADSDDLLADLPPPR